MLYKDKVVIVTGAASGIGRAAAIAFAQEGASVTVADLDRAGGEAVAQLIRKMGRHAIFLETDVTREDAIVAMVDKTVAEFGGLDAAFNNAGAPGSYSTAASCSNEEWDQTVRIDMTSVWWCMKYEIPAMLKRGGGAILNTASRLGEGASPNMFSYTATKHAVIGMTRSAAMDFAPQNIRVNALLPGFIATPMLIRACEGSGVSLDVAVGGRIPMRRVGRPEEPADVAVWLCSERASYITGSAISTDGGMNICSAG